MEQSGEASGWLYIAAVAMTQWPAALERVANGQKCESGGLFQRRLWKCESERERRMGDVGEGIKKVS